MSFSTIGTFSSLRFPSSIIDITYFYYNLDSSMSVYYTFDSVSNNVLPNYNNLINGKITYDANIISSSGNNITNVVNNYVMGKGALQITNTSNTNATQYVRNTTTINTNNNLSISVWFNPSNLSTNNLYTLFDIVGNIGDKGIQIDLSGTNSICYGYYDFLTINQFFNVDNSMAIYYPLCYIDTYGTSSSKILNYYNASNNTVTYDGTIVGGASIINNTANTIIGNGALQLTNTIGTTASQYLRNTTSSINTNEFNGLTISIWFNPTNLQNNNIYTLFDIAGSINNKGIQLDLSGTNMLYSALFY